MENFATWTNGHNIIHEVLISNREDHGKIFGLSVESKILNALKEAGLLHTEKLVITGLTEKK